MSKLIIVCDGCGSEREVDEKLAGTVLTCSTCQASIRVPRPDIGAGSIIGGFILEKQLGFGSMGEVWLAQQKTMDRKVALKLLSREFTLDSHFVERFLKEVQISAKMDHPNMVTAFDAGCDNDIYYLAITFVDGLTLEDKLEEEGVLNEKDALKVILDIASALKYAWDEYQIIHRDIKPANIMIDNKGVGKLMDLGISKSISEDTNLTMTGTIIGTPYYMSPEQGIGDRDLDFHTDIYSLGATLYHLVTGEVPFQATTALGIVSKHITEPFPPPQDKNPDVSDECSALLEIMMGKDSGARQGSWDEVIGDMNLVLRGSFPSSTKRPAPGDSFVMRAAGGEISTESGGADEVQLKSVDDLGSNIFSGGGGENSSDREKRVKRGIIFGVVILALVFGVFGVVLFSGDAESEEKGSGDIIELSDNISGDKSLDSGERADEVQVEDKLVKKNLPKQSPESLGAVSEDGSKAEKGFKDMWNFASDFAEKNPDKFDLAIANYREISSSAGGTKYKMMADVEIAKLEKGKHSAVKEVMRSLNAKANVLSEKNDYSAAAAVFRNYSGLFADETAEDRRESALSIDKKGAVFKKAELDRKESFKKQQDKIYGELASALLEGKWASAKRVVSGAEGVVIPEGLRHIIDELIGLDRAVFENIKQNLGKSIRVATISGEETIKIKRIKGNAIYIEDKKGRVVIQKKFAVSRLSPEEKVKRAGLSDHAAALYLASEAFKRKDVDALFGHLRKMKGGLGEIIIKRGRESFAEIALRKFLKRFNFRTKSLDPGIIAAELRERELSPEQIRKIERGVKIYRKAFGMTEFAKNSEVLLGVLISGGRGDESQNEEIKDIPAHNDKSEIRRIDEINNLLSEINPEYRGDGRFVETPRGHIILADFSESAGIDNRSLSAIMRLNLAELNLSHTAVTDISLLSNMSIRKLALRECGIRDLSPLKNMKSLKKLFIFRTEVDSLDALRNLRLESLDIAETEIDDLEPLKGMPLKALRVFRCPIEDFSPLAECKNLQFLYPWETWQRVPGKEYKAETRPKRIPKGMFGSDTKLKPPLKKNRDYDF
jgi:serine/threonine-protein kinase